MPVTVTPRYEDPFFFDHEALREIAPERIIAEGLRFHREHRVMDIDQSQDRLWADVEDEKDDDPLRVVVDLDEEGNLALDCECSDGQEGICGHQVAALCAYADQKDEEDQILTAADTAIKDRIKRARTEVKRPSISAGKPWFGAWGGGPPAVSATHYSQRLPGHHPAVSRTGPISAVARTF